MPGDIVLLEGGDVVTADARLLSASRLQVNESLLTGESVPVEKATGVLPGETVIAERSNMLFKGTALTKGAAEAVVVTTGMSTELGKITALVQSASDKRTPLEERIDALGKIMAWICIVLVTVIGILGALSGKDSTEVIKTAIARAVTVSFLILAGAQLGHVFNMVSPRSGVFVNEVTRNPWIWAAVVLCVGSKNTGRKPSRACRVPLTVVEDFAWTRPLRSPIS